MSYPRLLVVVDFDGLLINSYALLRLDTTATAEDVRLAIDRVRRALQ